MAADVSQVQRWKVEQQQFDIMKYITAASNIVYYIHTTTTMIFFSDIITNNISSDFCWCVDQKKHRQYWQEQHCFLIRYFIWWETLYYKWHYWAKELRIAACLMKAECYCILVEQSPNVNPFRTAVHLVVNQHHFDPHITLKACSFAKLNSTTILKYS